MEIIKNTLKRPLKSFFKINYFQCEKGNTHEGEKLNYVCINKNCLQSGLICSICKIDHENHNDFVIPLKTLLEKLKHLNDQESKVGKQQNCIEDQLQSLENTKNMLLYQLKITVQKLSQIFMNIEQNIIKTFEQSKMNMLEQFTMSINLENIIEQFLSNQMNNRQIFQQNIKKIAKMVDFSEKRDFVFRCNDKQILTQYEKFCNSTFQNLNNIIYHTEQVIKKPFNQKSDLKKFKRLQIGQSKQDGMFGDLFNDEISYNYPNEKVQVSKNAKQKYTFSTLLKGNSILIQKNGLGAKQTKTGSLSRFVMINEFVGQKQQKIAFKISKLVNWVGIGICVKQIITKANYAFKYEAIGHGSYLLSSNGYTWSHTGIDDNIKNKSFSFAAGQIIDVFLTQKQLRFVKRQNSQQLKLNINIKPNEWKSVCFCANLCSADDAVQIVQQ